MAYKIIANPNSSYENKIKAYFNFLEEKQKEILEHNYNELTKEEANAYDAGWSLAFAVAKCNLQLWFPEVEVK